jgi:acyl-CoA thioester hydrolase
MAKLSGEIVDGVHILQVRVYFEDTDFSGRVYHARYLQFMERGRSDYLRLLGIHHRELAERGQAFAVRHMEIDFLKPASIDDVLTVRTATAGMTGARITLRQEVLKDGEVLIHATVTAVLVGPAGRPLKLPSPVREALAGGARRA